MFMVFFPRLEMCVFCACRTPRTVRAKCGWERERDIVTEREREIATERESEGVGWGGGVFFRLSVEFYLFFPRFVSFVFAIVKHSTSKCCSVKRVCFSLVACYIVCLFVAFLVRVLVIVVVLLSFLVCFQICWFLFLYLFGFCFCWVLGFCLFVVFSMPVCVLVFFSVFFGVQPNVVIQNFFCSVDQNTQDVQNEYFLISTRQNEVRISGIRCL